MFLKLLIVGVLSMDAVIGSDESWAGELSGKDGGNGITVCLREPPPGPGGAGGTGGAGGAGGACRGALVEPHLVLVRASCLRQHPSHLVHMFASADNFRCDDDTVLLSDKIRGMAVRYTHPSYYASPSQNDFALIRINRPYYMDSARRTNNTYSLLEKLDPWIHQITELHLPAFMKEHRRTSPEKLFLMVVLLPFFSFILIFIYVTSGTSQPYYLEVQPE